MKTNNTIIDLIEETVGRYLEFVEHLDMNIIGQIVCSFLNSDGGQILLGIGSNKTIKGIRNAKSVKSDLGKFLINNIVPEAPISIAIEPVQNHNIISIKVWSGPKKPYVFQGKIFIRKGRQSVQASSNNISNLINNQLITEERWERQLAYTVAIEDLDRDGIQKTISYIKEYDRSKQQFKNATEFLSYYGLFQNGNLTNAAVVLFAKYAARFIPQSRVRITVFPDSKTGTHYDYDRVLEGNLFKNLFAILGFFDTMFKFQSEFNERHWRRSDKPKYPQQALREAVLNALIHRDYSNVSGGVFINVYPEKLEIINTGSLPHELKPADLKRNHLSIPRNPDIAHILFLTGWIEKIGRGTLKIIEDFKKAGLKEPKWTFEFGSTTLTFFSEKKKVNAVRNKNLD